MVNKDVYNIGVWRTDAQTPYDSKDRAKQSVARVKSHVVYVLALGAI